MRKLKCVLTPLRLTAIACAFLRCFSPALADDNNLSLGVEGFYDRYREPEPEVTINSGYGSVTGTYSHDWDTLFAAFDGRVSYGDESYKSPSGSEAGNPQWEVELRARVGANVAFANGKLSPYTGLGGRLFWDDGKHTFTNLGYFGYDRRIDQIYLPLGLTYNYVTDEGWTFTPTAEYDQLIWGHVNSRFQEYGGPNIENVQHTGYGLRGEFMVGQQKTPTTLAWQAGPFVRYWNIQNSDRNQYGYEPANTRMQLGMALRALW